MTFSANEIQRQKALDEMFYENMLNLHRNFCLLTVSRTNYIFGKERLTGDILPLNNRQS